MFQSLGIQELAVKIIIGIMATKNWLRYGKCIQGNIKQ